ncbi:hypothetical protein GCM10009804_29750 [Kribbella hippodromi]|uniref:Uncharacterized protein n=1 Tax=Kribbella hippodromi TaxID=434347 RepID=A0ABP4P5U5_9ACTN
MDRPGTPAALSQRPGVYSGRDLGVYDELLAVALHCDLVRGRAGQVELDDEFAGSFLDVDGWGRFAAGRGRGGEVVQAAAGSVVDVVEVRERLGRQPSHGR